jgi:hypothetical protein
MRKMMMMLAIVGIAVTACSSEDPEVSTKSGGDDETTTTLDPDAGETDDTTTTSTKKSKGASVEVAEVGLTSGASEFDDAIQGNAGAVLKNNGDAAAVFFEVVFTFKDGAGKPVGTETTYVYAIEPGGVGHAGVDGVELTAEATTVEASAIVDDSVFGDDGLVVPVTVESAAPAEYGGVSIHGIATNPGDEVVEGATVTCVIRSGGKITGSASTSLDTMVAGGEVAWEATSYTDVPVDSADCSASAYS